MAVSVHELCEEFGLSYATPAKWGEKIKAKFNGIYIISLTDDPHSKIAQNISLQIDSETFERWRKEATELEIEGKKVRDIEEVTKYLKQFWKPDENILYIGESTSKTNPIEKRINQFYQHKVGQKGPHSGGYWLKLISCLSKTHIFFAQSNYPRETEFKLLMKFVEKHEGRSFYEIDNFSSCFPFANLKVDVLKEHSIKKPTNNNKKVKNER
ncbi:MAG: hypothetical protein ABJ004_16350 [Cyclobacteriaceae bacterium]